MLFIYTENYARGGGNRYMIDIVNSIYDLFDKVMLTCNPGGIYDSDIKHLKTKLEVKNIPVITRPRIINRFRYPLKLMQLSIKLLTLLLEPLMFIYNIVLFIIVLRKTKPVLVISCNGGYPAALSTLSLVIAAKISKIPAILSIVSVPSQRKIRTLIPDRLMDKMVWRCVNAVIVNAQEIADKLITWRMLLPEKIHIVYNGIDPNISKREKSTDFANINTIGLIARLDQAKGVNYLVEAFITIHHKYPSTHLILAGYGDAYNNVVSTINLNHLQDCTSMLGYYDGDIQSLISNFDIYVFPSLHEGFPYSILEAMRAGCAIIATEVGGIPEAIRNNQDGILVKPGSSEALAEAIEYLLLHEPLRRYLGENAQKRFLEIFTLDQMKLKLKNTIIPYLKVN